MSNRCPPLMLLVLGLIDMVMISNLLMMVIVGGYETFVSRMRLERHPDQPEWLSHVNASVLKVKLALAIIGISSIHRLRTLSRPAPGTACPGSARRGPWLPPRTHWALATPESPATRSAPPA